MDQSTTFDPNDVGAEALAQDVHSLAKKSSAQTISPQARLIRGLRRMEQIRAQVYLVCAEATVCLCRPCLQLDAQGPHNVISLAMPLVGPRLLGKCRSARHPTR